MTTTPDAAAFVAAVQSRRPVTIIEPRPGWRLVNWKELYEYRDLFRFLVWRSIRARYAQSAIGIGWAVIQPLFSMVVFTLVFGKLLQVSSDNAPYPVFSLAALVPWTYFSNSVTDSTASLVTNANLLRKIYFPRLILPLSSVLAKLVDFSVAIVILFALMAWYGVVPSWGILMLPYLILLMMFTSAGIGLWLASMAIQYRDVNHAIGFLIQILMYATPVVYPASLVPEKYQLWYALNPMVGVIEGFRSALVNTRPMPWDFIAVGSLTALVLILTGIFYFRRKERIFADVA